MNANVQKKLMKAAIDVTELDAASNNGVDKIRIL